MYFWACNDTGHEAENCSWICRDCGSRLPGALGHGPPCSCSDVRSKTALVNKKVFGPATAAAIHVATDPFADKKVRKRAIEDLLGLHGETKGEKP